MCRNKVEAGVPGWVLRAYPPGGLPATIPGLEVVYLEDGLTGQNMRKAQE